MGFSKMYRLTLIIVLSVYANLGWGARSLELSRAIRQAESEALRISDVTQERWKEFLKDWMEDSRHSGIRSVKKWREIKGNLLLSFDNWRANKLAASLDLLDEETKAGFEGAAAPATPPGKGLREEDDWGDDDDPFSPERSVGTSAASTTIKLKTVAQSPERMFTRTNTLIRELSRPREELPLTTEAGREATANRFNESSTADREAALKALLEKHQEVRHSYIKVLLGNIAHRADIRKALIGHLLSEGDSRATIIKTLHDRYRKEVFDKSHHADHRRPAADHLRDAHAGTMVASIMKNEGARNAMIAAIIANAEARGATIGSLEQGRYAVNSGRLLAHPVDEGLDAFWNDHVNGVVLLAIPL